MFDEAEQDMPHAISVTPAEQEAIERVISLSFRFGTLKQRLQILSVDPTCSLPFSL